MSWKAMPTTADASPNLVPFAQHIGAGPTVVGTHFDAEQIAHLAIEVGQIGLRSAADADLDVALGARRSVRMRSVTDLPVPGWQTHIDASLARPVLVIDEAQEMLSTVLSELRLLCS